MAFLETISQQWFPVKLALGLIVFAAGLYRFYLWLLPKPFPGIPYNVESAKKLLGDAPDMNRAIRETQEFNTWCAQQNEKHKSALVQVFVDPFQKPWLLLSDFAESQDILMRRKEFDRSTFISDRMSPLGDFQARFRLNNRWKMNREWVKDLMAPTFLENHGGPGVYRATTNLCRWWTEKARLSNGRPFEAGNDMNDTSLDVMLNFSFGQRLGTTAIEPQIELLKTMVPEKADPALTDKEISFPHAPVHQFISLTHESTVMAEDIVNSWTPLLSLKWLQLTGQHQRIFKNVKNIVRDQIRNALQRLAAGETMQTAIDHMMMREKSFAEKRSLPPRYEHQHMVDEVFGDLFAGHHTTGAALAWIVKFMSQEQECQRKLRAALYEAYPAALSEQRPPTYDEMKRAKIPYLDAFVEEALRLHATTVTREALSDTVVLGHHVPKGTVIFLNSNGPGFYSPSFPVDDSKRSPTTKSVVGAWDETKDMKAFEPERWLVTNAAGEVDFDANAGPQLIFGLGPRGCFGRRLAYIEMRSLATLVCWNFNMLQVPDNLNSHAASDGISHKAQQCYVRPQVRSY